jgi:catechol 2,3-dioxygenase-like lactoylglutathione lyase family enzyme
MTEKLTRGIHHIGLTVPDLDQARAFFCGLLGFDEVGGVPDYP